jgi:hypothetical protein
MVHAADIEWPTTSKIRRSPITYRIDGDILIIGQAQEKRVWMRQSASAITMIIEQLRDLENRRVMGLDEYETKLFIYLARLLGVTARFVKDGRDIAAGSTVANFMSREEWGFHHDLKGRAAWTILMARNVEGTDGQQESDNSTEASTYILSSPP